MRGREGERVRGERKRGGEEERGRGREGEMERERRPSLSSLTYDAQVTKNRQNSELSFQVSYVVPYCVVFKQELTEKLPLKYRYLTSRM